MPLIPFGRSRKRDREDELRRKWGSNDPYSNEQAEQTHRWLLQLLRERVNWDWLKSDAHKHFLAKMRFEEKWNKGLISRWQDFYMTAERHKEKLEKEYEKRQNRSVHAHEEGEGERGSLSEEDRSAAEEESESEV